VRVFDDPAALARAAADRFGELAALSIRKRGSFHVALAGGSTPLAMYKLLAGEAGRGIDWSRVHVYWGDERCVPATHADSNAGAAAKAMIFQVPLPASNVHTMRGEIGSEAAAEAYETLLRALARGGALFDLVLLGMGTDGHTASLFPGRDFARDHGHLAVAVLAPPTSPVAERVTITFDAIQASSHALLVIAGEEKREMLARVREARRGFLEGTRPHETTVPPTALVHAEINEWYLDRAAAGV